MMRVSVAADGDAEQRHQHHAEHQRRRPRRRLRVARHQPRRPADQRHVRADLRHRLAGPDHAARSRSAPQARPATRISFLPDAERRRQSGRVQVGSVQPGPERHQRRARRVRARPQPTDTTQRVSVDSFGNQANGLSGGPGISGDGRFVAFASFASNLVPDDGNGFSDVYVYDRFPPDRDQGIIARVSVGLDGAASPTRASATSRSPSAPTAAGSASRRRRRTWCRTTSTTISTRSSPATRSTRFECAPPTPTPTADADRHARHEPLRRRLQRRRLGHRRRPRPHGQHRPRPRAASAPTTRTTAAWPATPTATARSPSTRSSAPCRTRCRAASTSATARSRSTNRSAAKGRTPTRPSPGPSPRRRRRLRPARRAVRRRLRRQRRGDHRRPDPHGQHRARPAVDLSRRQGGCLAGDANCDCVITVDELIRAVINVLNGCSIFNTCNPAQHEAMCCGP